VTGVAFSSSSGLLASSGRDRQVRLWGVPTRVPQVIGVAEETLTVSQGTGLTESCTVEAGENLLAVARASGGEILAYAGGMGCAGQFWLTGLTPGSVAWEDEAGLESLLPATVPSGRILSPIRSLFGYDNLCTNATGRASAPGEPPFTLYAPSSMQDFLPQEMLATSEDAVEVVICHTTETVQFSTCAFDGGLTQERVRINERVTLVDFASGGFFDQRMFPGETPPECPETLSIDREIRADPLDPETTWVPWVLGIVIGREISADGGARTVINIDNMNAREQPTTASAILTQLSAGTPVNLIARSANRQWLAALLPDMSRAWLSADFIDIAVQTEVESLPVADGPADEAPIPLP
jgi:hypothetical protein